MTTSKGCFIPAVQIPGREWTHLDAEEELIQPIIYDPTEPHGVLLSEAPGPQLKGHTALIGVHEFALNFIDVAFLKERGEPGSVIGIEAAGTVLESGRVR